MNDIGRNGSSSTRVSPAAWPFIGLLRLYRYTLSMLIGRTCRHLPTCSEYMEDAMRAHGAWPGGWIGVARLCRCHPWGTSGFDPVPARLNPAARWYSPWRYGRWRSTEPAVFTCEALPPDGKRPPA